MPESLDLAERRLLERGADVQPERWECGAYTTQRLSPGSPFAGRCHRIVTTSDFCWQHARILLPSRREAPLPHDPTIGAQQETAR